MIRTKRPALTLKRARTLTPGEVIAVGDLVVLGGIAYRLTALDTRWVGVVVGQHTVDVYRPAPPPDRLEVETRRAIARTSRGKLEALLAERAAARRRLTMAQTRLDLVEKSIANLARAMAEDRFKSDLADLAPLVP